MCEDAYGISFYMAHRWGATPVQMYAIVRPTPLNVLLLGKHETRTQRIALMPAEANGIERAIFMVQKLVVILDSVHNII